MKAKNTAMCRQLSENRMNGIKEVRNSN